LRANNTDICPPSLCERQAG